MNALGSRASWSVRIALLGLLATLPTAQALAQDDPPIVILDWSEWLSEVPMADLSGNWQFLPDASDPMVEAWIGVAIAYRIDQQPDRIRLDFAPEDGQSNRQGYRWDGRVAEIDRPGTVVRERARWTEGGRTLEIEGRWWPIDDVASVRHYTLRYYLARRDLLVFEQIDEHGTTTWRFERAQ